MIRLLPPKAWRSHFWVATGIVFLLVFSSLIFLPRGGGTGGNVNGPIVAIEVVDGVTFEIEPTLQDQGWLAYDSTEPYALAVRITVHNDSDAKFPRWLRVDAIDSAAANDAETLRPLGLGVDALETMHVSAGASASSQFDFQTAQQCGEFTVIIEFVPDFRDYARDVVEVPLSINPEGCSAE